MAAEKRIVDMAPSATGKGYYITASNGAVYAYGDAKHYGGLEGKKLAHGIISMVALNNGEPPIAADDVLNIDEDGLGSVDVLANDRDPDGGPLSIQSVSAPGKGGYGHGQRRHHHLQAGAPTCTAPTPSPTRWSTTAATPPSAGSTSTSGRSTTSRGRPTTSPAASRTSVRDRRVGQRLRSR